jgi:transposase
MHESETSHLERSAAPAPAWHLKQQGWSQRRMAVAMGVSEGAVSQWMTRAREAGSEALQHRPPPGAPRRPSPDQLERLLRALPGRVMLIWEGTQIHRRQVIRNFLANGAAQRLHLERLPAYAPELNPGEGLWQQLKGVELRHVCCFNIPHLRDA